jgi:hypothetical protein
MKNGTDKGGNASMSKSPQWPTNNDEPTLPALRAWEKFWFEPADPTLLGFVRICVGCVALYVLSTWGYGLMSFVGPDGWVDENAGHYLSHQYPFYSQPRDWDNSPGTLVGKGYFLASPYFHVTDPFWVRTIHLAIVVATFLFTIGYQTRITSVLAWLGALCYMLRCQPLLFGMDTMINLLLLYLSIAPSGAALSVDRWLEVRRLRQLGATRIAPPAPEAMARLGLRLLQIHFCIIYLAAGLSKLQGPTWWSGTALWGCFANFTFAPVAAPWYQELLRLLSRSRLLWEFVMTSGIVYTFVVELGLPFLVWLPRFRPWFVIGSILLHAGIGPLMGLPTFSALMMCMVLSFTPPELVRPYLDGFRNRRAPQLPPRAAPTPQPAKAPALAAST